MAVKPNQQRKRKDIVKVHNYDPSNPYGHKTGRVEADPTPRSSYEKLMGKK